MWAAPEGEDVHFWNSRHRVVEEVDSDDTDAQGVGLAVSGNRRFKRGEPLQLTGSGGNDGSRSRRGFAYHPSGGESTEEEATENSDQDTEDEIQIALRESEEALAQSALARIRKAQAKGRQDVKLNKEELAALDRRRKRLQAEAAKKKKNRGTSSNGGENRRKREKEKEQRYAVPLSHFDAGPDVSDDALPRHPSPATLAESQERVRPPKGRFPPPNSSRSRPRATVSSSQIPQSEHESSSPFEYKYVEHPPPNTRHISDPSTRTQSYYPPHHQEPSRHNAPDPFMFLTGNPRAPYPHSTVASRSSQGTVGAEHTSEEEASSSDDHRGSGAHIPASRGGGSGREEIVVHEASPEPEHERSKGRKSSSSTKRKPVGGGSSGAVGSGGGSGGGSSGRRRRRRD
ncbi:hypothetical protein SLS62_001254 [Diatrype stigma]|uniref:Uncharacterized protein n=1 Tax=Diatrype stigma TaxID=117547 RepID=A0AAN9V940_9PEZI